ncbi:hypothetical protein BDW22DRAFT_1361386 [Trametopsis cervina]|nr:hypothetical protein BDW22DRAFT_1361386 [Trametopsis cervina]
MSAPPFSVSPPCTPARQRPRPRSFLCGVAQTRPINPSSSFRTPGASITHTHPSFSSTSGAPNLRAFPRCLHAPVVLLLIILCASFFRSECSHEFFQAPITTSGTSVTVMSPGMPSPRFGNRRNMHTACAPKSSRC